MRLFGDLRLVVSSCVLEFNVPIEGLPSSTRLDAWTADVPICLGSTSISNCSYENAFGVVPHYLLSAKPWQRQWRYNPWRSNKPSVDPRFFSVKTASAPSTALPRLDSLPDSIDTFNRTADKETPPYRVRHGQHGLHWTVVIGYLGAQRKFLVGMILLQKQGSRGE